MNQDTKVALAVLSAIAIGLQAAYPHASWIIPITTGITAMLGAFHLVPSAPAVPNGQGNGPAA